ncbi:galectin [Elysia marginata]|uniref:Galectin n=1 Tax=Elysia marginata TaxID=1093978 RepID=A0AAV4EP89_9GAST|nr:galectin [Elysia marginata]
MYFTPWLPMLATVTLISGQCDVTPSAGIAGQVSGTVCLEYQLSTNMTAIKCILQCFLEEECRVAYIDSDGGLTRCVKCQGIQSIEFTSAVHEKFYLHGEVLTENLVTAPQQKLFIAGGLAVGQVVILKGVLWSQRTFILFTLTNNNYAFLIEFRLYSAAIVRNAKFGYWGHEERSKPHFNFTAGQEVEIVCIVGQEEYVVFMDKLFFFTFRHRTLDLGAINYLEYAGTGTAGSLSSFFITS